MKKFISKVLSLRSYFIQNKYLFAYKYYLEQELKTAKDNARIARDSAKLACQQLNNFNNEKYEGIEDLKNHVSWQCRFIEIHGLGDEYKEYVKTLLADAKEEKVYEYQ